MFLLYRALEEKAANAYALRAGSQPVVRSRLGASGLLTTCLAIDGGACCLTECHQAMDREPRAGLDGSSKMAILSAMGLAEQLPLAEVKNRLSEVVEQVETQHARVTITKHGRPAAVVISADDLDSLEETLRVLSDPELLAQVRASRAERDQAVQLSKEEAARLVGRG